VEGVSLSPYDLGVRGSLVSSPSGVQGKPQPKMDFTRRLFEVRIKTIFFL